MLVVVVWVYYEDEFRDYLLFFEDVVEGVYWSVVVMGVVDIVLLVGDDEFVLVGEFEVVFEYVLEGEYYDEGDNYEGEYYDNGDYYDGGDYYYG